MPDTYRENLAIHLQGAARREHLALGCADISRTDYIVDENNTWWALEASTIPEITETSILPTATKAAGVSYEDLRLKLIKLASVKRP